PAPTPVDLDAFATQVAGQVIAQITQTAAAQPTPTLEPTAEPTATPAESPTPEATAVPLASPTAATCDNAAYVADISIPDGTSINAGAEFLKTWRIKNTGTCTWKADYRLVYGYPANGPFANTSVTLGKEVAPGATVDLSVTLKAPAEKGSYTGAWRMSNSAGFAFGEFVTVAIVVP
ncbi:MAG: NBR1-Ig-like domain-containing protein, partial [Anaerolineales bacterium]